MPMAESKQNVIIYAWHETMHHHILSSLIYSTYTHDEMFIGKRAYRENQSCVSTSIQCTHTCI